METLSGERRGRVGASAVGGDLVRSAVDPLVEDANGVDIPLGERFPLSCASQASFEDFLSARTISTGKSAMPIVKLPIVPSNAAAPPEIGSHGPSSVSYSRGR